MNDTEFIERVKKVHGERYLIKDLPKEFNVSLTKIKVICPIHGEFSICARSFYRGHGCQKCGNENRNRVKRKLSYDEVIKRTNELYHGEFTILTKKEDYINTYQKIKIKHNLCGKILDKSIHDLFRGRGCKECSIKKNVNNLSDVNTKSFKEIKDRINKIYGGSFEIITDEENYINTKNRIKIKHKSCGNYWNPIVNNLLLKNTSCPHCRQSSLEAEINSFLIDNNIEFIVQKHFSWLGLQTLDFYLPKYNTAIECQGGQHFKVIEHFGGYNGFKNRIELDERKRKLCNEHNVKLLYYSNLGIEYPYKVIEDKDELLYSIKN